jgi:hypothetical protein
MCNACIERIQNVFQNLTIEQEYRTPDAQFRRPFIISAIDHNSVTIMPQSNGLNITRAAFEAALHYLVEFNHTVDNTCEIRSNNRRDDAGPLCIATRGQNHNVRCINYILPILAHNNLVDINGEQRPNTTWLIN